MVIFESKNGRWMITRGEGRWNVRDNQSHKRVSVKLDESMLTCKEPLPEYVLKHIQHDAKLLEAIAKRNRMEV